MKAPDFYTFFKGIVPIIPLKILLIALVLLSSIIIIRIGRYIIDKLIEKQKNFKFSGNGRRIETVGTILKSLLKYGVYFISGVTILTGILNLFDAKTVLAAAGIGGVALGFGAQSMVRDIISGFFILIENQFAVGDVITIGSLSGTVEEMELRVTKIRNFNGELYIIPNGEIKMVTNLTKGDRVAVADVKVSYDIRLEQAIETIEKACKLLEQESTVLAAPPEVLGVIEFRETCYVIRAVAKVIGSERLAETERDFRRKILKCFEESKLQLGGDLIASDK